MFKLVSVVLFAVMSLSAMGAEQFGDGLPKERTKFVNRVANKCPADGTLGSVYCPRPNATTSLYIIRYKIPRCAPGFTDTASNLMWVLRAKESEKNVADALLCAPAPAPTPTTSPVPIAPAAAYPTEMARFFAQGMSGFVCPSALTAGPGVCLCSASATVTPKCPAGYDGYYVLSFLDAPCTDALKKAENMMWRTAADSATREALWPSQCGTTAPAPTPAPTTDPAPIIPTAGPCDPPYFLLTKCPSTGAPCGSVKVWKRGCPGL